MLTCSIMSRKKGLIYSCYALLPLLSVFSILTLSWLLVAIIEIYTNNLTMLNTLNRFTVNTMNEKNNFQANPPFPGRRLDNVFWFVQVSDIHISKFRSHGQVEDFEMFCNHWLPIIKPTLVLLTGDLTDAKDATKIGSSQYEEEWVMYSSLIKKCRNIYSTTWLDIRGNHDSFGVSSLSHSNNMFEKYGISKMQYQNSGVYQHIHNTGFGKYSFNGIDLAPNPGPGRPFNFFGVPQIETLSRIKDVTSKDNFNATIWFGHYPLSTTTNPHLLRKLLSISGVAYLCGHLHTLLDLFPQIHVVHSEGLLELEIGDWKEGRRFRIGVFDHDIFSFADVTYLSDPIVVFTNPVDARYLIPQKLPFSKSWNSTHIRFLVFSLHLMSRIEVVLDDVVLCTNTEVLENVLHICKWNPQLYMHGMHNLTVITRKDYHAMTTHSIQFSLDGTRPPLSLFSVVLLLTDFYTMLRVVFITTVVLVIVVPIIMKKFAQSYHIVLFRDMLYNLFPQILIFIDCDSIFWPLIYYNCYLCVGPFSIGHFVPGQIGFAFPYGIYTGGRFIEGSISLLYVSGHMLIFNFLMMLYFGELLQPTPKGVNHHGICFHKVRFKVLFIGLLFYELYLIYTYSIAYGMMSSFVNALSTLAVILLYFVNNEASKRHR